MNEQPAGEGASGTGAGPEGAGAGPEGADAPDEAELRRRIEEGLRDVRVQDVLLESVVTLVNLTARRIAKPDERDLDQARVGIEAVRAVLGLLEPEPQAQVRNALSELQVLFAQHSGEGGEPPEGGGEPPPGGGGGPAGGPEEPPKPGGEDRPSGLWTPPGV